jgi:hypothetical protein
MVKEYSEIPKEITEELEKIKPGLAEEAKRMLTQLQRDVEAQRAKMPPQERRIYDLACQNSIPVLLSHIDVLLERCLVNSENIELLDALWDFMAAYRRAIQAYNRLARTYPSMANDLYLYRDQAA